MTIQKRHLDGWLDTLGPKVFPSYIVLLSHQLPTTSFLTSDSLSDTMSFSSAMSCRSSWRLSLFLNFSSVPSSLQDDRLKKVSSTFCQTKKKKKKSTKRTTLKPRNETILIPKWGLIFGGMRKSDRYTAGNEKMDQSFASFFNYLLINKNRNHFLRLCVLCFSLKNHYYCECRKLSRNDRNKKNQLWLTGPWRIQHPSTYSLWNCSQVLCRSNIAAWH